MHISLHIPFISRICGCWEISILKKKEKKGDYSALCKPAVNGRRKENLLSLQIEETKFIREQISMGISVFAAKKLFALSPVLAKTQVQNSNRISYPIHEATLYPVVTIYYY